MATRKKELLEQESIEQGAALLEESVSAEGCEETGADSNVDETLFGGEQPAIDKAGDGMDLNELLENMDAEAGDQENDEPLKEDPAALAEGSGADEPFSAEQEQAETEVLSEAPAPTKPKRSSRKKKEEPTAEGSGMPSENLDDNMEGTNSTGSLSEAVPEQSPSPSVPGSPSAESAGITEPENPAGVFDHSSARHPTSARSASAPVLTIENRGEVETAEAREDAVWHEIHNAYRTRKILTGQLGGIEQTDAGKTIAIADYKGFRIVIPLKEMMINLGRSPSGQEYAELMLRQNKILGNMLGAEIDFIVRGIDSKSRSVVASRREAMLKKRQIFYLDTDASGMYRIYDGRIVQARVIAVAEKVIRVEIFGVECSIMARDLAWDWIGDAHERFSVGDQVLVRVLSVRRDSLEDIGIRADIKSVSQNNNHENLKKCRIQSKYAGKVTDVHKGVVYIRLSNGVNAVAHSCYDYRTPGKKDDVSFAVTRIDEERGVAVGIITRIIRQNL